MKYFTLQFKDKKNRIVYSEIVDFLPNHELYNTLVDHKTKESKVFEASTYDEAKEIFEKLRQISKEPDRYINEMNWILDIVKKWIIDYEMMVFMK